MLWSAEYPEVAKPLMSTRKTDRFLETGGARLRWRLEGSGPCVVLLHGWALDLDYWEPVTELLALHFTVLRFDRRGFGRSEGAPDIHSNVGDLLALLNAATIDRTAVIGMSQGARLAIHFAIAHAARTQVLVLDGPPALEAESDLPLQQFRALLETSGPAALQTAVLRHPLMQLQARNSNAHRLLASVVSRYRGEDLLHPAIRRQKPDMAAITAPTLILNGDMDSTERRESGRTLQAAIPGAQRVMLAGAGHLAALDDPPAYADAVYAFCSVLP
jgi:3-oxoadipate enol-lactonase